MKMSELERRTGARREAIRVYFRKGLLPQPKMLKPNVAEYGEEHVRGIQTIRRLLSEKRLSLDEIGRALAGHDAAVPVDAATIRHLDELLASRLGADDSLVPLSSIKDRNPKAEADAKAMHRVGAIELVTRKGERFLSRVDAQIVGIWGDMRAGGYTEELGFRPEVCRLHVEAAEKLARAELDIFLEHLEGRSLEGPAADMAQLAINSLLSLFGLVRMRTVLEVLRTRAQAVGASPPVKAGRKKSVGVARNGRAKRT